MWMCQEAFARIVQNENTKKIEYERQRGIGKPMRTISRFEFTQNPCWIIYKKILHIQKKIVPPPGNSVSNIHNSNLYNIIIASLYSMCAKSAFAHKRDFRLWLDFFSYFSSSRCVFDWNDCIGKHICIMRMSTRWTCAHHSVGGLYRWCFRQENPLKITIRLAGGGDIDGTVHVISGILRICTSRSGMDVRKYHHYLRRCDEMLGVNLHFLS